MTTHPPYAPAAGLAPVGPAGRPGVSTPPPPDTPGAEVPSPASPRAGEGAGWPQPPAAGDVIMSLTLDVVPTPKGRPRVSPAEYTVIGGQRVRTKKAHGYTPERTRGFEDTVGWALRQAKVRRNDTDELGVRAIFYAGGNWDTRPDLDNCLKALLDASNKIVFLDDQQIVQQVTDIVPATGKPCVEFTVYVIRRGSTR